MTAENTADQDRILSRVRKMMNLANDAAATEGERDAALRAIHATLAKHNLSMADAETHGQQAEGRTDHEAETRNSPWARRVASAIGSLMFCRYYFHAGARGKVSHHFIGRQSNAVTAAELAKFVIKSINSEATKHYVARGNDGPFYTNFCKGAAETIQRRCADLRRAAEAASQAEPQPTTGTALVLASHYANELEANNRYLTEVLKIKLRTTVSRDRDTGSTGRAEGRSFGGTVSLNRQLGTASTRRLK